MAEFIRSIDDIIGHKYIVSYLKGKLQSGDVPNVMLFNGSAGLGKTSLAKVLAISINGNKSSLYEPVINNNESTDCIKLFNMSSIGDDTESVVSELQGTTFSSTGKKVVILDEVHGMTKKAQDAILVTLEYLPEGVYVIMCTTEMGLLRDSLISRCVTFNLNHLTFNEMKEVISRKIESNGLSFDISKDLLLNLIASWSSNQPRRALNLLEAFTPNSYVTKNELSAFIDLDNISIIESIINYLYGSLTLGIDFINTLTITRELMNSMIEVLKVCLGYTSPMMSNTQLINIRQLIAGKNLDNYKDFTIAICSNSEVSKTMFVANFIKYHSSIYGITNTPNFVKSMDNDLSALADQRTIGDNAVERLKQSAENLTMSEIELKKDSSMDTLWDMAQKVQV